MASSKAERDALLLQRFDSLVELSAPAREARLVALRQDDPELAAALRAMLAADGTDGPLEAVPGLVAALHVQNSPDADGGALNIGDEVGPFILQRCLGQGGMGEVWLASRTQDGFHQQVALKRIRRGMNSATALRRFQAERRILAELSHPHIARFIDGGVDTRGLPWYAMSFVEGLPLNRYVQEHALGVRERVALLLQVTDAVAYAQNQLIVHRDLKPSNVLVDGEGVPHLLDFGIAKLIVGEGTQADTLTAEQALTPMYAAPEQILGGRISTATDVYALGVMLYELLTDTLPHARVGLSLAALVAQVRGEISERPSLRLRQRAATGEFRSGRRGWTIDADLDAIVLNALRSEPERRYASAAALADDLRRWLEGSPVRARADTAAYRVRKFIGRHRYLVGSAAAVLLALLAGFGTALWQAREARVQAQLAAESAESAHHQSELARQAQTDAEAINRFFASMLANARAMDQSQGSALTVQDWVLAALPRLDLELRDAAAARATLRRELGTALLSLGDAVSARPVLEQAVREADMAYGPSPQAASARGTLSAVLYSLGETDQARVHAEAAIDMIDHLTQSDGGRLIQIQARTTLIRVHNLQGEGALALELAERNLADRTALYGAEDDPRLAVDYNNLATSYSRLGRLDEADVAQRRSLELLRRTPDPPVARIAFVEQSLCMLAVQRARYAEAHAACERAAEGYGQALGPGSIELVGLAANIAHLQFAAGESAQAGARLDNAIPKLVAAGRQVDLRLAWLVELRLALHAGHWRELVDVGEKLLEALPEALSDRLHGEQIVALSFARLGRYALDRDDALAAAIIADADALLARSDSVPYYRASVALAGAVAAQFRGDLPLSRSLRARGIGALATHMPESEAQALWLRWWPQSLSPLPPD